MAATALFGLTITSTSVAQTCHESGNDNRPRVGLVLGGGGARGYAHVGVLKYLEEMRVPIDYIAGTSMGAIVGGFLASGMSAGEIEALISETDWNSVFSGDAARQNEPLRRKSDDELGLFGPKFGVGKDSSFLPGGVVAGQNILLLFEDTIGRRVQVNDFDHLPIPYRAVATDIAVGQHVVLSQGSISAAMRASMAVPGVFDPVRLDGHLLVDGGLTRNLPIDVVRQMGADVVIAVDVGTPLMPEDRIGNVISVVEQMTALLVIRNTEQQVDSLGDGDILVRPELGFDISSSDFDAYDDAIPVGYAGAEQQGDALSRLSMGNEAWAEWRRGIQACETGEPVVHFVQLDNQSRFSDDVLRNMIHVPVGEPLDVEQIEGDMQNIYGLGFIRLATYHLLEENGQTGIRVSVVQDQRGTDFLETGLTISGNRRGSTINIQAGYLVTDLDERGSEARAVVQLGEDIGLLGDIYKYMDDGLRWYANPELAYSRRSLLIFDDTGVPLADAEIEESWVEVTMGRNIGRSLSLYGSLARYVGEVKPQIGVPFEPSDFDGGEWAVGVTLDRLDDLFLPSNGALGGLEYVRSDESLGADDEFEQIRFNGLLAKSWGRHNIMGGWRYNITLDNNAPLYALFTGGGFLNMSGFEPAEINGENFGMVLGGYRYQVRQGGIMPGYVGGTIEYGNAADDHKDLFSDGIWNGSLYFAYNSPLGPIYMGYGWNEDRSGLLFLRLGAVIGDQSIGRR
ncbi:patatin-like phospholipase family protein [Marinihelvus fidelis]|uniref:patatin-like phospholipase family protein n=1 Tax=Marinihelvus fidelis TaxID=2613842 RepID=UPI0017808360|nr:patatin-like phospholipase family protein [Marinihelvus fidelis]